MTLGARTRLGPYVIERLLGAGGMGEVYRARDTRLERSVAVKILPPELSGDAQRRSRFEREAKVVSRLSHPHICSLFDIGTEGDVHYLVMELLEGVTLEERSSRGPLPVAEVLRIGREIASALDAAHRQSIVHRDIKPGNIFLTSSGAKLLDFGLASAHGPLAGEGLTSLPTQDDNLTAQGAILGTFHYMSPEAVEGLESDPRSDIFSLGAVLYQIATGRQPFQGQTPAKVIAAILESDPAPISSIVPSSPPRLDRVVRICLAKQPEDRWQSAHDLSQALDLVAGEEPERHVVAGLGRRAPLAALAAAAVSGAAALGLVWWLWPGPSGPGGALVTASFPPPPDTFFNFIFDDGGPIALSPGGDAMVFSAGEDFGKARLWLREMETGRMTPLPGTEGATFPFWSADGSSVGYFADHKLKRFDLPSGPPRTVCDAEQGRGGTWNRQGTIVFAPGFRTGLFRVNAEGGRPEPITELQEGSHSTHRWPRFLPDGDRFVYLAVRHRAGPEQDTVFVDSLSRRSPKELLRTSYNVDFAMGHLFYVRGHELVARAFDPKALELAGAVFPVAPSLRLDPSTWSAVFTVSPNGLLALQEGSAEGGNRLEWFDRSGKSLGSVGSPGTFWDLRLSSDERTLAVGIGESGDMWLFDLERQVSRRFTSGLGPEASPLWSLDGEWLHYSYAPDDGSGALTFRPHRKRVHGSDESVLFVDLADHFIEDISADGQWMVAVVGDFIKTNTDIALLSAEGAGEPRRILYSEAMEFFPRFSPDGRWLAYASDFSGRLEVYLTSVPAAEGRWQVSSSGGSNPVWRKDGRELYYLAPNGDLIAVEVELSGAAPRIGSATHLFRARPQRNVWPYDVADGGQRFVVNTVAPDLPVTLVVNWKPRAPAV